MESRTSTYAWLVLTVLILLTSTVAASESVVPRTLVSAPVGTGAVAAVLPSTAPAPAAVYSVSAPSAIGTAHAIISYPGATPSVVNPISIYPKEPAPMGISDMGVDAGGVAYAYDTQMLMSNVTFTSQDIYNSSLTDGGARYFTWQMNAFLGFVQGGKTYYWWVQDVATMDTDDRQITFMDCVWNATTATATLPKTGTLSGNGSVSGGVYSDDASNTFGANVTSGVAGGFRMIIEATQNKNGEAVVYLGFSDQDTPGYYEDFDTVTWLTFKHITNYEGFVVNGNAYDVWGTAYDAEIMVGGPFNGDFTVAHSLTDISMQIYRWNGHNFEAPQAAWNFGSETAESISDLQTYFSNDGWGAAEDTTLNGTTHVATTAQLYGSSQVGVLTVSAPSVASGSIWVGADQVPYTGGLAYLTLDPGTYHVWLNSSAGTNDLGLCTISAGSNLSVSVPGTCSGGGSGPSISSFTLSPNPVTVGSGETMTVSASGGTAPLSYAYSGLPPGCSSSNVDPLSCTPSTAGTYPITVTVTDAASKTASASATLTVNPSTPTPLAITSFTANPADVSMDWSTTLSVTTTGGTAPLAYVYTNLPPGCATQDLNALNCVPTVTGHYNATVEVTDSSIPAAHAWANASLYVEPAFPPLNVVSFTASPSAIDLGMETQFNVTTSGGDGWVGFHYSGLPTGCASIASDFFCTPSESGKFAVEVNASISGSSYAHGFLNLTVDPSLTISELVANPAVLNLGQTTDIQALGSGGATPYSYAFWANGTGCSLGSTGSASCTPAAAGSFQIVVVVSDANGASVHGSTGLTVSAPSLALSEFVDNPSTITLGQSTAISAVGSGGAKPYVFTYWANGTGCSFGSTGNNTCTPTVTGTFQLVVVLTDADGYSVHGSLTLTVNAAPATSGTSPSGFLGLPTLDWIVVAVVAVIALVLGVLLVRRKPSDPYPTQAWPPPEYPQN